MTSLLPRPTTARPGPAEPGRPLALVATTGGVGAALATLVPCLLLAVVGWFLTDAGAHGTPRDALQVGALGWLVAHGSGVSVRGTAVTVLPLGLTLLAAWATWRVGRRAGEALSGHGPDADRLADGERDWTVPGATALFAVGYAVTVVVVAALAADPSTAPSTGRALGGALLLAVLLGGTGLAVGSGRAAVWLPMLPRLVRPAATVARAVLTWVLGAAALLLLAALLLDGGAVLQVVDDLGADAGDVALLVVLTLLLLPGAVVWSAAWLLGPGFGVGAGTVVSPALTVLGALPLVPLVPALPAAGSAPRWVVVGVAAVPVLLAAVATARVQRHQPTLRWDDGVLRGCVGGVAAGVLLGVLAALAGGALGPGRMAVVGPLAGDVLVHAVAALGVGGALGGAVATAWQRRAARRGA
ncbi:DUF6350 family protein [Nocardioides perillae]|uniref:Uncharacterized protein n=1 Tax=Nocardioides perillae TaxID=1119534 RepID=A0A7Y9RW64_9ACTN|nr:DUF6350 family protein [Nocardioides perillae]NYG55085.1 hypothetical protein [Nocardioides perillae]